MSSGKAVFELIKQRNAFDRLLLRLKNAYHDAWEEQTRQALAVALAHLREVGPGKFTSADQAMVMTALEMALGGEAMMAALYSTTLPLSEALYRVGAEEIARSARLQIRFQQPDLDAMDMISKGNLFWIGDHWDSHTQKMIDKVLLPHFEEGLTRLELGRRIEAEMAGIVDRGNLYWDLVADHAATKTREMGRVTGYQRAGIVSVEIRAQLDDRTSDICRALHGRIISVSSLESQRSDYIDAIQKKDKEAAKKAWPMLQEKHAHDIEKHPGTEAPPGIGNPPYHFFCRTITIMHRAA